jgi:Ca2+-binding EF-hand superfamily protein
MKTSPLAGFAIAALLGAGFALQAHANDEHRKAGHRHDDGLPPMFEKFDTNQDGKLSKDEVRIGVDKAFAEADTNKDGSISKEEMRAHHQAMHDKQGSAMSARWKAADKDGDGALSRAEVDAAGMKMLSRDFDALDKNHDGKLMPDEIRDGMMMRHHGGAPAPAPAPAPASPAK